jgi:sugar lactone lactonase YvrE
MPSRVEVASGHRAGLGESPLWHRREQAFYWVDINADHVFRLHGESVEVVSRGEKVTALAETSEGGLLLVTPMALLFWSAGTVARRVPISIAEGTRTNDGKCDPGGRMWFGTMDLKAREAIGSLYRYDGVEVAVIEAGITLSNGLGWSPDRESMYHVDTTASHLYVYRYDAGSGRVEDRRILVDMTELEGWPDGLAVDADGNIWVAMYDGWCLNVFERAGKRIHVEELEVQRPTSAAFGGSTLDVLYVTTASQELDRQSLEAQPDAGKVLRLEPGVCGLPVGRFGEGMPGDD